MKRICAWCDKDLDGNETAVRGDPITHGICESCALHFTANELVPLRIFLDGLEPPVLLVDSAGVILAANESARRVLGIDPVMAEGSMRGDVLRCSNAPLPGGCGKSDRCAACEIQGSVTRTFETGLAMDHVSAYLEVQGAGGREQLLMRISTERVSGSVLLRLDSMEKVEPARKGARMSEEGGEHSW
jgi:PAS domain-containing protein